MVSSRDPHSKDVGELQLGDKKVTAAESLGPQIFAHFFHLFFLAKARWVMLNNNAWQRLHCFFLFFVVGERFFSGTCSPTIEVLSKKKRLKPAKGVDWRIIFEILTPQKSSELIPQMAIFKGEVTFSNFDQNEFEIHVSWFSKNKFTRPQSPTG